MKVFSGYTFDDVLLVPKESVVSRRIIRLSIWLSRTLGLELPIISANMDTVTMSEMAIAMAKKGALGVIHRFLSIDDQVKEVKRVKLFNCIVGAAVGVKSIEIDRAKKLVDAKVDLLVVDIAHGHSYDCISMVEELRKSYPFLDIMAGNVATDAGAIALARAGANIIKTGIGPGSVCLTRKITGFGVPQLTAIEMVVDGLRRAHLTATVVADGGMVTTGDIVKALAVGANAVMLGSRLAGCAETPGELIERNGKQYKIYRGMASKEAMLDREEGSAETQMQWRKIIPEGIQSIVPYKGSASDVLDLIEGEMRSAFSYGGALNIEQLQEDPHFVLVSPQGLRENSYHDVITLEG